MEFDYKKREEMEWTNGWWDKGADIHTKRWVLIGDSIMRRIRSELQKRLRPQNISLDFFAQSFSVRDPQSLRYLEQCFALHEYPHELAVLNFGGHHGIDISVSDEQEYRDFRAGFEKILFLTRANCPHVVLATFTHHVLSTLDSDNEEENRILRIRNQVLKDLSAEYGLPCIDFYTYMRNEGKDFKHEDRIHFVSASNSFVADYFFRELQAMDFANQERASAQETSEKMWERCLRLAMDGAAFLKNRTIGQTTASKAYLYALVRLLSICRPQQLLEFGFDDATKIAAQYAESAQCRHEVYDWDYHRVKAALPSWGISLHHTEIYGSNPLPVQRHAQAGMIYPAFAKKMQEHPERKFDAIFLKRSIVRGGGTPSMDIMPYIPQMLTEDFVILVDHSENPCARMMVEDLEQMLREAGKGFRKLPLMDVSENACVIASERWAGMLDF